MQVPRIPHWARLAIERSVGHSYYPFVVGMIAFVSTATFTFPFVFLLIPAVLLAPRRWLVLGLSAGIASGVGGGVLVEMFQYLGHELVLERFPQLFESEKWLQASAWVHQYGLWALAVIAGSPIPQTPAVLVYSLADPSSLGAMFAIGIGKTVKYVFLAWLTERYPARFVAYRRALEEQKTV